MFAPALPCCSEYNRTYGAELRTTVVSLLREFIARTRMESNGEPVSDVSRSEMDWNLVRIISKSR